VSLTVGKRGTRQRVKRAGRCGYWTRRRRRCRRRIWRRQLRFGFGFRRRFFVKDSGKLLLVRGSLPLHNRRTRHSCDVIDDLTDRAIANALMKAVKYIA
jgi:hypothetical protein